jgi:hypothetical protein
MRYYRIRYSTETKIIGNTFPQASGVFLYDINDPGYIHNAAKDYTEIKQNVIVPKAKVVGKSTKITDLMSCGSVGFSSRLLISDRLKIILEKNSQLGFQYFGTNVLDYSGKKEYGYWLLNSYVFFPEYIEFDKAVLFLDSLGIMKGERVYCDSFEDFEYKTKLHAPRGIYIENYTLNKELVEYDFFTVNYVAGVIHWIVSENLKNEIEAAGCTGIDYEEV